MKFTDFYIKYKGHPKYNSSSLIEDDVLQVLIQKYEMIINTNKGEVFGDPEFGADLLKILYDTYVDSKYVEDIIHEQIYRYIPEIVSMGYTLEVLFMEDQNTLQDIMVINFTISDYSVYSVLQ